MKRLANISYHIPNISEESKEFFDVLKKIFEKVSAVKITENEITFIPSFPENALPTTSFVATDIGFPVVILDTDEEINIKAHNLYLRSKNVQEFYEFEQPENIFKEEILKDDIGEYVEISFEEQKYYQLFLSEFERRLRGHIVGIDHTGVDLPASCLSREQWDNLLIKMGSISNIYRYPSGEDWPFVVPSNETEFKSEIMDFEVGRSPRFELVYNNFIQIPLIQIDVQTDLTRSELEKLIPAPYGVAFPELENFFRSVFIRQSFYGLILRFDLRFKNESIDDFDTGKFFVDAGRIK